MTTPLAFNDSYINRTENKQWRPPGTPYHWVTWHGTGNSSGNPYSTLNWNLYRKDPRTKQVIDASFDALGSRTGELFRYVDPHTWTTWHAGASRYTFQGRTYKNFECSLYSLGFECDEPNDGIYKVTQAQITAMAHWRIYVAEVYNVPLEAGRDVTHAQIAPGRKHDPKAYTIIPQLYDVIGDLLRQPTREGSVQAPIPIFAAPSIGFMTFAAILNTGYQSKQSPAHAEAAAMFNAFTAAGVDPVVPLAVFWKESKLGTMGRSAEWHNLGNVRTPSDPTIPAIIVATEDKGSFVRYQSWTDAAKDWAHRMQTKYRDQRGITTLQAMVPVYSPATDGNIVREFIEQLTERVAFYRAMGYAAGMYEVSVAVALVREQPTTTANVALHGTAKPSQGNRVLIDGYKIGQEVGGNPYWLHRADGIGFMHSSVLRPIAAGA